MVAVFKPNSNASDYFNFSKSELAILVTRVPILAHKKRCNVACVDSDKFANECAFGKCDVKVNLEPKKIQGEIDGDDKLPM